MPTSRNGKLPDTIRYLDYDSKPDRLLPVKYPSRAIIFIKFVHNFLVIEAKFPLFPESNCGGRRSKERNLTNVSRPRGNWTKCQRDRSVVKVESDRMSNPPPSLSLSLSLSSVFLGELTSSAARKRTENDLHCDLPTGRFPQRATYGVWVAKD